MSSHLRAHVSAAPLKPLSDLTVALVSASSLRAHVSAAPLKPSESEQASMLRNRLSALT